MNSVDDCKNYLPAQGEYDDLFLAMIEYCLRAAKSCIVLDYEHLDGVAGQELRIKDKQCTEMYVIFVYLVSKALSTTYILEVLKECLMKGCCCKHTSEDDLPISRLHVMYLLLEFFLTGEAGIFPKVKKIANLSVTMCSSEICDYCYKVCEEIEVLERGGK